MKTLWLMSAPLVAAACGTTEAPVMTTTLTSAGITADVDPTVEQITTDRCNRQLSCGNVGKGLTWRDRYACEIDVDKKTHNLIGQGCTKIDVTRLSTCLNEIRNQTCDQSREFPASCAGANLCR